MIENIVSLIGRFHPLLVHLPIGILLVAALFRFVAWRKPGSISVHAILICIATGAVGAIASCITGLILLQSAEYDASVSGWHQWLGISVAAVSIGWFFAERKQAFGRIGNISALLIFILLMVTGHLGGTLTHGEGYLSLSGGGDDTAAVLERKPILNVQEALVYEDVVRPAIAASCYSCHGASKQKGKLRLDLPDMIMKGGKNGEVIDPASVEKSELVARLLLPESDKKHMPPKDKKQLSKDDIALIHWWVEQGASFDKKVKDLKQTDKVSAALKGLQNPVQGPKELVREYPEENVSKASDESINALRDRGVVVLPVSSETNYLSANFVSTDKVTDADLKLLSPIRKQLVSLKVDDKRISDAGLAAIAECDNLVRLNLNNTDLTDAGLDKLSTLKNLREISLIGTKITGEGVLKLKQLESLRNIYLYRTSVSRAGWAQLQQAFPKARLDSGNYQVPILESDTTELKIEKKK